MEATATTIAFLFPGALGDFLCWLPALAALRRQVRAPFLVIARDSAAQLLKMDDTRVVSIDRAEIADLFHDTAEPKPATRELFRDVKQIFSWTGSSEPVVARRLTSLCDGAVAVLPFRGMRPGEHAVDYYGRCVGVRPAPALSNWLHTDDAWAEELVEQAGLKETAWLAIHAGSGSPKKNWLGFADLTRQWRRIGPVVELRGPAETAPPIGADHVVADVSLPRIAALLGRTRGYVGNDSGISHLAGAIGAPGVALFGASDPDVWSPRGKSILVTQAATMCVACEAAGICTDNLPVELVLESLHACLAA